jgi:hypothetical protein
MAVIPSVTIALSMVLWLLPLRQKRHSVPCGRPDPAIGTAELPMQDQGDCYSVRQLQRGILLGMLY